MKKFVCVTAALWMMSLWLPGARWSQLVAAEAPTIPRIIPPAGIEVPPEDLNLLKATLAELDERLQKLPIGGGRSRDGLLDVEVYLKAVRYAIENGEFFDAKDVGRANDLLTTAAERISAMKSAKTPWTSARGLVVRGYRSVLDDSPQPYGLVIPENLDLSKPVPLYVWLHGRGDTNTDLRFIHQRQTSVGQISPPNAIVLHPFGRYCNAFKFAGEVDVYEAIGAVSKQYPIDAARIVLWGFSMGGAGAWHLGAHSPSSWVAVSPGAGFAETARYQNLDPQSVPDYERKLWGLYDVPGYVRNLFNVPLIAYSGEMDKQIQAARVMEEAFAAHDRKFPHLIGPGMGHKYHPDTLKELAGLIESEVVKGRDGYPREVHLQTQTLRYNRCEWLAIERLGEHWQDARVDAKVLDHNSIQILTKNVERLTVSPPWRSGSGFSPQKSLEIDGEKLSLSSFNGPFTFVKSMGGSKPSEKAWRSLFDLRRSGIRDENSLAKRPGLQGPIDDVFMAPFLVVEPSGKSAHPQVDAWVAAELAHFKDRWRRLFRGELRVKKDYDVADEDLNRFNVIVWGDRSSNRLTGKVVDSLPIRWSNSAITAGDQSYPAAGHVLSMIYPNPESPGHYVVLNSGPTFREAHDRSNSLQTPKLPDWAVIDLSQPPDDKASGKIAAAGFFDEAWQLKSK